MCGIAGVIDFTGRSPNHAAASALDSALRHRGPDGGSHWRSADGAALLVHRRLSILDVSDAGQQPMSSANGRFWLTYNGEIYNFLEIRDELRTLGHEFRSDSDSEVILAAYSQWGEEMLFRFNGMWALAIWDVERRELFLARDRFGVKPLYYSRPGNRFAFASEIRALRAGGLTSGAVNFDIARRLVVDPLRVEGGTETLYSDVWRLQGGHLAKLSARGLVVRRWWNTLDHLVDVPAGEAAQADRFRELFDESVRLRMRSDVPIGTCLSGGFDSTAVTCAMARLAGDDRRQANSWRHAFVASFPGWEFDERARAETAARWAGIDPTILEILPSDGLANIDDVLDDNGDVYLDPAIGPWMIYREVRRAGIVVTLDGHGADELMGGYRPAGGSLKYALQTTLASWASRLPVAATLGDSVRNRSLVASGMYFVRGAMPPKPTLLGDTDKLPSTWGPLSRSLYAMFHSTILPTLLRNYDRSSMAHGVEVRMPFMDWRLVTYVMSLPDRSKSTNGLTKKVARDALQGAMPEVIRSDPSKIGFNSPMESYLSGPLREWTRAQLASNCPAFDEIVDRKSLAAKIDELTATNGWTLANSQRIWPYLALKKLLAEPAV